MKHTALLIIALTLISSCQKDMSSPEIILDNPISDIKVRSSVKGKIADLRGIPIPNAEVILAGETQISNDLGLFNFDDIELDPYGSLLSVDKSGYFSGRRRVSAHEGTSTYVELRLLSDVPTYNFDSEAASVIEDMNGVLLNFKANSISNQDGQAYTGRVNVALQYIDPTADNIESVLPGSLQGYDDGNQLVSLKSYSMIAVQLTDDSGEELQIKRDETVTVEFPIPESQLVNAPSEIPLWSLDEDSGLWIEEGSAALVGSKYVGQVSHFSYWNCDVPLDFVIVEGNLCQKIEDSCEPMAFYSVIAWDANLELGLLSRTDSEGNFTLFIPRNGEVTIQIRSLCGVEWDQPKIGPFSENTDIGIVELNSNSTAIVDETCPLPDDVFVGTYTLSHIEGPGNPWGTGLREANVELAVVPGSSTMRAINGIVIIDAFGGFDMAAMLIFNCDVIEWKDTDSGVGCGEPNITLYGGTPQAFNISDDSEIIIEIREDGGPCGYSNIDIVRLTKV